MQVRFHHAVSNYEETTRIPIVMSLPGVLPSGVRVDAPVSNVDIAPTVLELLGLAPNEDDRAFAPPARARQGATRAAPHRERRAGTRAILYGDHRLLLREGGARITTNGAETVTVAEELFDLANDPGERHNIASSEGARVTELRARLDAALKNVATADVAASAPAAPVAAADVAASGKKIELRFVGGGRAGACAPRSPCKVHRSRSRRSASPRTPSPARPPRPTSRS
ncbi:MAG: sulfatase-like hydrolase/transferase [Polyangiaceae bacterium]